jgi:RNA polymerase sigma factor (sigma-70 family)
VPGDALGEATLARARAGDDEAFRELTDPHRRELQLHCYRILGSMQDAEDLVQETLLAAWRSLEAFEGRASVRAWLYRIATNRCLNALRARSRRPREVQAMVEPPEPTRRTEPLWLEPYPDVLLEDIPDRSPGRAAGYGAREAVELAYIVALQRLPPRQRAALVLRDVLGFRAAEVADMLDTGEASVTGALQRARAALEARLPDRDPAPRPSSARERQLVGRFADAVQSGDITTSSPCSPTTRCSRCRRSRSSTRDTSRSPPSFATARSCAARRCASCPPVPTASRRSAATSRTRRRRSPALRTDRADARGGGDRGDHLVRRHRCLPTLRAASNAAEPLRACPRRGSNRANRSHHCSCTEAEASPLSIETVARDDAQSSAPPPNSRLLSAGSNRVRTRLTCARRPETP